MNVFLLFNFFTNKAGVNRFYKNIHTFISFMYVYFLFYIQTVVYSNTTGVTKFLVITNTIYKRF